MINQYSKIEYQAKWEFGKSKLYKIVIRKNENYTGNTKKLKFKQMVIRKNGNDDKLKFETI